MNSKHLDFKVVEEKPKTKVWGVFSKHDAYQLGRVVWYPSWRQYIFEPSIAGLTVWSTDCLDDLSAFIREKKFEHKHKIEIKGI